MASRRLLCSGTVAAALLAGCSTTTGASVVATSTAPSPIAELPPRPRDVPLDAVDQCALLTPQQRAELGLNRPPRKPPPNVRGEQECEFQHIESEPYYRYLVGTVLDEGAEAWLDGRRVVDARPRVVAGFGAVETRVVGDNDFDCMISIDAAPGQTLNVSFLSSDDVFSEDDLCERALVGAEAVMQTLLATS